MIDTSASAAGQQPHMANLSATMTAGLAGRKSVEHNVGSRRRFWSLVGAVGAGYVIAAALILLRAAGI